MKLPAKRPRWLVKQFYNTKRFHQMKADLERYNLSTVCQNARCPNMSECFSKGRVAFLIMGSRCSRGCRFCFIPRRGRSDFKSKVENAVPNSSGRESTDGAVKKRTSKISEEEELHNILSMAKKAGLRHVVITSVTRDDLPDKGAGHFARLAGAIRKLNPEVTIETLIPDFSGERNLVELVCSSGVDIVNHNIETVPRLYPELRPQADYQRSLNILKFAGDFGVLTKSGIILGMGEKELEVLELFTDLRKVGVDILTIGQYLKPGKSNLEVKEFIPPEKFEFYRRCAYNMEFKYVSSGPFVRSSYQAEETVRQLKPRLASACVRQA